MKKIFLFASILLLSSYINYGRTVSSLSDSIRIFCTPGNYGVAVTWAEEYNSSAGGKIMIIKTTDAAASDLARKGVAGFAGAALPVTSEASWKMIVGRDVIVPVINSANPFIDKITASGVTRERLAEFISNQESRTWGMLPGTSTPTTIRIYCIDDPALQNGVCDFLGISSAGEGWIKTNSEQELLATVKNDRLAIGFCRLGSIMQENTELMQGISILPIDRNSDGRIGAGEDIYKDLNAFLRGVWIGKYPSALVHGIYFISPVQPEDEQTVAFLKWILDNGQQYLGQEGYTALVASERQNVAARLASVKSAPVARAENPSIFRTLLWFMVIIAVVAFMTNVAVRLFRRRPAEVVNEEQRLVLDDQMIDLPGGIYFDKTHTWAFLEKDGFVRVGIDDFMRHITGRINQVKMKSEGDMVKKGEEILSLVRNGKHLTLYAPVTGIIRQRNLRLENDAEPVNASPYGDGWVYLIEPANWVRECQLLTMAEKHRQFIMNEMARIRDFMAEVLAGKNMEPSPLVLQDGGALMDGPLADMSPEVWEEFQTRFIDPSRHIWFYELY
jgi:glycine cleavage system H lipoate-binding protein/ABC-type phosphate transport system substrate-binding protein